MAKTQNPYSGTVDAGRRQRFEALCQEWTFGSLPLVSERAEAGIGTLCEKPLHAVIKRFLCPDVCCHEVKVEPIGNGRGGFVADVRQDGHIYEVQTGSWFPLERKIDWYLTHTDHRITVVCPLAYPKHLYWIDPTDGSVSGGRRAPGKSPAQSVARELYWVRRFIGNPRFSVQLLLIDWDEYRLLDGRDKTGKSHASRVDRIPRTLEGILHLQTVEDYRLFLDPTLPELFTAAQYTRATGIRGKAAYGVLSILCGLGLLELTDQKQGRSRVYRQVFKEESP